MDPGVSLFSGEPEALRLNGSSENQREEEEEALEDQRRRDQELKKLLTDAFDDLMDDEDDDDQSIASSSHQNGLPGHSLSTTGSARSKGSNHQPSPHYYPYRHVQVHSSGSSVPGNQFENGCYRSPLSEPVHDNNGGGSPIISQFRNKSDSFGQVYSNGYPNIEEMNSLKLLSSNQNDADHFGYLSTIPQVDFTGNENLFASNNGHLNGSHPAEDRYRHADLNSQDQVMVLYTARMQEVSQLSEELATLRRERDTEVEQLKRKLLLVEAEKQGAFLSHKEAQTLLGEYQTKISNLHRDIEDLRLKNITLEKSKEEVVKESEIAKSSAADLLQKISILERNGSGLQSEKHVESFLKTVQQQHDTQIKELQSQIDNLTQKFSQKDHECCVLERKLRDSQRTQEALIIEKGEVVNELNKQLEEAQRRVRELASAVDNEQIMRLKLKLEQVSGEQKSLEEQLAETTSKLKAAERDLKQYETVSKMGLLSNGESSFETDSITHLGISRRHSLGARTERGRDCSKDDTRQSSKSQRDRDDLNIQLRNELHRALQGQRSKREEIHRLQGELAARDLKIKTMKEQEKVYFIEAEKFKKNLTAVLERLKRQEEEAKALEGKSDDLNAIQSQVLKVKKEKENVERDMKNVKAQLEKMKSENDSLREQLADMELQLEQAKIRQVDQTAAEFLAFHDESLARLRLESSRQLEAQVVDYRVRMEQAQKECEEIKRLYVEVCSAKRAMLTDLKEEQANVRKLTTDLDDMKEAQESLEELHKQERDLNTRLRDELDKEKAKTQKAIQQKDSQMEENFNERIASIKKEYENQIKHLQKARDEAVACTERLQQQVASLEVDYEQLNNLKKECSELRNQAIEGPKRQQAELERISRELKQSRERVIQLEKRLRAEFQSQMDVMIAERDAIQAQLKQKDTQLEEYLQALSRMKPPTREMSVNTENGIPEALKTDFDEKLLKMNFYFKAKEEEKVLLLEAQHKAALASAEEQVKEETVKYFAEEISCLEEKHRSELGNFAQKIVEMENAFGKHLSTLKNALQNKTREVEDLNTQLQNLQHSKGSVIGNAGSGDSPDFRLYVEQLKNQTENDRHKMTEALTRWADEIKGLQARESLLETKLEEMKAKYKNARKAALHYKKMSEEKEKHMVNEWNRLQSGYREALNRVQARVVDIVGGQEQEVAEQLKRIESYYEGQIKDLASKLKHEAPAS